MWCWVDEGGGGRGAGLGACFLVWNINHRGKHGHPILLRGGMMWWAFQRFSSNGLNVVTLVHSCCSQRVILNRCHACCPLFGSFPGFGCMNTPIESSVPCESRWTDCECLNRAAVRSWRTVSITACNIKSALSTVKPVHHSYEERKKG